MKAVLQKVKFANVKVDGEIVGEIKKGILVFLGIDRDDNEIQMNYIIKKILGVKLWSDEVNEISSENDTDKNTKKWTMSVIDKEYEILVISQFTLNGSLESGNKLNFHQSMHSVSSRPFFDTFIKKLKSDYQDEKIKQGRFGAQMEVNLSNDGPVTIILEKKKNK